MHQAVTNMGKKMAPPRTLEGTRDEAVRLLLAGLDLPCCGEPVDGQVWAAGGEVAGTWRSQPASLPCGLASILRRSPEGRVVPLPVQLSFSGECPRCPKDG
jgi:hypothetical protein